MDVPVSEHVLHVPAAELRPYLGVCTGYREAGGQPAIHRGLPSPYMTVIFTLDEPLVIAAHPDPAQRPGSFGILIGGLHTVPALITHQGSQSGIQLSLSPLGTRALLSMPAGEIRKTRRSSGRTWVGGFGLATLTAAIGISASA